MTRRNACTVVPAAIGVLLAIFCVSGLQPRIKAADFRPATVSDEASACASCHQAVVEQYLRTPMADASGAANQGLIPGAFQHPDSAVEYRVFAQKGQALMSYRRPAERDRGALSGERELIYFVGSGHRGRTYLYQQSGLWFEAPINFYSKRGIWDMAPNYGKTQAMPDGLPVDPNCLHCHASRVQASLPGARNRFAEAPFLEGGLGCSSCHGDPASHLAHPQRGNILNPATLDPVKRDGVCLQCHLEGDAAIYRAGKSLAAFRPGDTLSNYVDYFVKADAEAGGARAASQYEALLRSACRKASGDRLTCTTCHDPHSSPAEADRVAYFRGKCLSCHSTPRIAVEHHPEQKDCAVCHMPSLRTSDISHEQTTDHNIQRVPASPQLRLATLGEPDYRLVPVGDVHPGDREYGLAYAQAAQHGNRAALLQGLDYLRRAEALGNDDPELFTQAGLLEQLSGHASQARTHYDRALALDPNNTFALGNKAVLEASRGDTAEALRLFGRVLENNPAEVAAALNLALIQCSLGQPDRAVSTLNSVLVFSPDDPAVRTFLRTGTYAGAHCDLQPAGSKPR